LRGPARRQDLGPEAGDRRSLLEAAVLPWRAAEPLHGGDSNRRQQKSTKPAGNPSPPASRLSHGTQRRGGYLFQPGLPHWQIPASRNRQNQWIAPAFRLVVSLQLFSELGDLNTHDRVVAGVIVGPSAVDFDADILLTDGTVRGFGCPLQQVSQ